MWDLTLYVLNYFKEESKYISIFQSFLKTKMLQVVEIIFHERQGLYYAL